MDTLDKVKGNCAVLNEFDENTDSSICLHDFYKKVEDEISLNTGDINFKTLKRITDIIEKNFSNQSVISSVKKMILEMNVLNILCNMFDNTLELTELTKICNYLFIFLSIFDDDVNYDIFIRVKESFLSIEIVTMENYVLFYNLVKILSLFVGYDDVFGDFFSIVEKCSNHIGYVDDNEYNKSIFLLIYNFFKYISLNIDNIKDIHQNNNNEPNFINHLIYKLIDASGVDNNFKSKLIKLYFCLVIKNLVEKDNEIFHKIYRIGDEYLDDIFHFINLGHYEYIFLIDGLLDKIIHLILNISLHSVPQDINHNSLAVLGNALLYYSCINNIEYTCLFIDDRYLPFFHKLLDIIKYQANTLVFSASYILTYVFLNDKFFENDDYIELILDNLESIHKILQFDNDTLIKNTIIGIEYLLVGIRSSKHDESKFNNAVQELGIIETLKSHIGNYDDDTEILIESVIEDLTNI